MTRLVIPDDHPAVIAPSLAFRRLDPLSPKVYDTRPSSSEELTTRIREADVVINVRASSRFTADVLEQCKNLKLISIWGTGTDNVDLVAAQRLGIQVANTPGVNARAVAEHTIALILAVSKHLVDVDRGVRAGQWPRAMVQQFQGRTLGLLGTGAIGRWVARMGAGLGFRVIAWTFHPDEVFGREVRLEWVTPDALFTRSDVLSIHVRQSPETLGMVSREALLRLPQGALVVNTARGAILDEDALVDLLVSGHLGGAGLDVYRNEPLPIDSRLRALPNVVLTPHSAGITPETTEAGIALAIDNVFRFIQGEPRNLVF